MGICRCGKRANIFCYVHRKYVCSECITFHPTCFIDSYVNWLKKPDHDKSKCAYCKNVFEEPNDPDSLVDTSASDETLRLAGCLHIVHKSCFSLHIKSFPPGTARAGFSCPHPGCTSPVYPGEGDHTKLASLIRNYVDEQSDLHRIFFQLNEKPASSSSLHFDTDDSLRMGPTQFDSPSSTGFSHSDPSSADQVEITIGSSSRKAAIYSGDDSSSSSSSSSSSTASPSFASPTRSLRKDDDDNKYKKKGVAQLFSFLGFTRPGTQGYWLNKRVLVLLILLGLVLLYYITSKTAVPITSPVIKIDLSNTGLDLQAPQQILPIQNQ